MGCTNPYHRAGPIGFARIGYADIPAIGAEYCGDPNALVVEIKNQLHRHAVDLGLDYGAMGLSLHIRAGSRHRVVEDHNPDSASFGMRKRLRRFTAWLELDPRRAPAYDAALGKVYL